MIGNFISLSLNHFLKNTERMKQKYWRTLCTQYVQITKHTNMIWNSKPDFLSASLFGKIYHEVHRCCRWTFRWAGNYIVIFDTIYVGHYENIRLMSWESTDFYMNFSRIPLKYWAKTNDLFSRPSEIALEKWMSFHMEFSQYQCGTH